jgi:hypothetical protein
VIDLYPVRLTPIRTLRVNAAVVGTLFALTEKKSLYAETNDGHFGRCCGWGVAAINALGADLVIGGGDCLHGGFRSSEAAIAPAVAAAERFHG